TDVAPLAIGLMLAMAAAALAGWRGLPAVALGALAASLGWPLHRPDGQAVSAALALVAQAAFGGMLLRRSARLDDLALDSRPAMRRLVAAAIACGAIGAFEEVASDLIWAETSTQRPGTVALVRFTADACSVLIGLPILLGLLSPLVERWRARRRSVAMPLLLLSALLLVAFAAIHERDRQAAQQRFERDAEVVMARTQALLDAPVQAVMALHSAMQARGGWLADSQFDALAQPWLKRSIGVNGIGWLEQAVLADGTAADAAPGVTLRHVMGSVPSPGGVSLLAAPALRNTLRNAAAQAVPVISPVVPLGTPPEERNGFVVALALPPTSTAAPRQIVFATVSAESVVQPLLALRTDSLRACVFDADLRAERRRLAGASGCESSAAPDNSFLRDTEFEFGGRRWVMRIHQPVRTPGGVWLFALPALAGGALLAVLLALATGRVQQAKSEAASRSQQLRQAVDARSHAIAHGEQLTHDLMDAVQVGVALVDGSGRVQRANAAFAELLGRGAETLRGQTLDDLLLDDDRPQPGRFARLLGEAGPEPINQSLSLRIAGGRVLPALVTLRPQREHGRVRGAVCALHDLSENLRRRQAERVLGSMLDMRTTRGTDSPRAPAPPVATHRVLCVAGNAERADGLAAPLREREDLSVAMAQGAEEGLMLARSEAPRVVLLDLDLSGDEDGLILLATLCDEGFAVIALSDDPHPDRIDAAFSAGARAYLTRPIDARELLAAIDDLT
ncbi:MAG: PAS domain-containing protein, partial [Burkholderiales bacterium]|nr:PAS domain-containing protein [Burkholderiales bacterium]